MKVAIASEHSGYYVKEDLLEYIRELGHEIHDLGAQSDEPTDYPYIAARLAKRVSKSEYELGILICGTGIGMSIAASKIPGIRAAVCTDSFSAKMAREHNDANILCLGAWITGKKINYEIVNAFLSSKMTEERHIRRINLIREIEQKVLNNIDF